MNFIHFTGTVFQQVVEATVLGSVFAVFVLTIQWVIGRKLGPAWRHTLWLLVLLRLVIPVFPESRFSIFNVPSWIRSPAPVAPRVTVTLLETPSIVGSPIPIESTVPEGDISFPEPEPIPVPKAHLSCWELFGLVWLSASWVLLLRLIVGSCWLRMRLSRDRVSLDPAIVRLLSEARWRMGTFWNPRTVETSSVDSPGLFGAVRPRILLPRGIAEQLSETEMRHVFLHEMAHLKRGDLWTNLLMSVVQVVHWFNPVVWFVLRRMRLERELACDALVLRTTAEAESRSYGETILKLLERIRTRPTLSPVVGILEEKHSAASRLKQIAEFKSTRSGSSLLAVAIFSLLALIGLSNAQTDQRRSPAALKTVDPASETPRSAEIPAVPAERRSGIDLLRTEYEEQKSKVEKLEKQLDEIRSQIGLSETGFYSGDSETTRTLERDYTEARSTLLRYQKMHESLKARSRKELRKVIPTVCPDAAMDRYFGDLAKAEQEYASKFSDFGPKHPEIVKIERTIRQINQQIEDRIDGVVAGVELQVQQTQALADELEKRLAESRKKPLTESKGTEIYFSVKRQLEEERRRLETIHRRLLTEEIDSNATASQPINPPGGTNEPVAATILIGDARVLMEMGKMDEAEAKLNQVAKDDPENRQTFYYLKIIRERRLAQEERRRELDEATIATGGPAAPDLSSLFPHERKARVNPYSARPYTSAGRNTVLRKLEKIVFPEWHVQQGTALSEILKTLQRDAKKNDPDESGVNFILGSVDATPALDPQKRREPVPVEAYETKQDLALSNVPLKKILQALVEGLRPPAGSADADPVVYSVLDYAVVFHQRRAEDQTLYTRTYKLNPNVLADGLDAIYLSRNPYFYGAEGHVFGPGSYFQVSSVGDGVRVAEERGGIVGMTNSTKVIDKLRNFFVAAGLNFEAQPVNGNDGATAGAQPRKALFYNDKTRILMVRATLADLDIVENALQILNMTPPQVVIESRFVKLRAGAAYKQDLLLRLIATNEVKNVITVTELMSDPQFKALMEALGNRQRGVPNLNQLEEQLEKGNVLNGVLTERQLRDVLKALQEDGVEVTNSPRITTLSGRAARVEEVDPGPTAAVLPVVEADGKTINLSAEVEVPADKKRNLSAVKAGAQARLWNGQTLAFRAAQRNGESIVVLLTPTIVDAAGNRVHSPDSIPDEPPAEDGK